MARTLPLLLAALLLAACSTAPRTTTGRSALAVDAQDAMERMKEADPGLQQFFDTAHAYAIFPSVGKAGFTGTFALAAQASAIVLTAGASVDADYDRGVAARIVATVDESP